MILITLQITGKEMCSLPKEEFLARAPAFMGDILWAHLEILQKDVDRGANIENVPVIIRTVVLSFPTLSKEPTLSLTQWYHKVKPPAWNPSSSIDNPTTPKGL